MSPLEATSAANGQGLIEVTSARPVAYVNGKDLAQRLTGAF